MIRVFCTLLGLTGVFSHYTVAAKTVGELVLECSQATQLRANRNPVGIDPYQIATCFGYLEAHIDLRPRHFCLPDALDMTALASRLTANLKTYPTNANASAALTETLSPIYPCPE